MSDAESQRPVEREDISLTTVGNAPALDVNGATIALRCFDLQADGSGERVEDVRVESNGYDPYFHVEFVNGEELEIQPEYDGGGD